MCRRSKDQLDKTYSMHCCIGNVSRTDLIAVAAETDTRRIRRFIRRSIAVAAVIGVLVLLR
jgi:hypothetical protein